jgi:6-pyruvoyltetrahydropterin/6-carboxytetrahydropterin synthase
MGHENKCAHLHGHNYVVHLEARALLGLDSVGRVVDFSVLKDLVGGWIDDNWDHGFIFHRQDEAVMKALGEFEVESGVKQKWFALDRNPTAENLASYLLHCVCPQLLGQRSVQVIRVVVEETENCSAEARL